MGDELGDEPIDMGDDPSDELTDIDDDPDDEPTYMGDYEDQLADTTKKVNEDLTGPFPGGPNDPSILKSFHCHERGTLKCLNHGFKVSEWSFNLKENEQSKFHDDVSVILVIPVIGKSVSYKKLSNVDAANLLVETLGVIVDEANVGLKVAQGQSIKVEWLRQRFGSVSDADNDNTIECATRAYLLYFLGCTLFANKTGTCIPVVYLSFLMDLRSVASYAWGAAALAFLYRQLGTATRPYSNLDYKEEQPRVFRWISRTQSGLSMSILQRLRENLDRLEAHDVIWDPYHDKRIKYSFFDVAYYSGCLKCMHIIEPYHPDRVLRQFGWRIDNALSISRSMIEIGYNETTPTRDMLRNAMKKITQVWKGQQSTEEHTPSETLVYTRRTKRGATS
ncbi:protein MAIN-LIKE 1-like [Camellia sinensis]|uniref:protein MAIN-LIKE 1-like n=1 Tax=Camellia sinensis TaxID=4442 RepID=UPI001035F17F|nr:protein MAIN-LIKE 1-like [Camellia sinensis]